VSVAAFLAAAEAAQTHDVPLSSVPGCSVRVRELSPMDALQVEGLLASIAARAVPALGGPAGPLTPDEVRHLQRAAVLGITAIRTPETPEGEWEPVRFVMDPTDGCIPVAVLMAHDLGAIYAAAIGAGRRAADTARAFRHGSQGGLVAGVPDGLGDGPAGEDLPVGAPVVAG
jgi:hypothetical protein